jgi:mannose-P-dolichol utilization defect protein 1
MDLLRSTLQPITHSLPPPLSSFASNLLGEHCYQLLVLDIDPFTDPECLKLALSKGLGIGIVAASSIVKVPQILKLLNSKSAEGVSFLAYLLETVAYLIGLAYNFRNGFPFSTYGETALIIAQNVVISVLVLVFGGRSATAGVFVAGLAAAVALLFGGVDVPGLDALGEMVDMKMLSMLQAGAGTLGVLSKVPQIAAIWKEGGTGQLSAFTVSSLFVAYRGRVCVCVCVCVANWDDQ